MIEVKSAAPPMLPVHHDDSKGRHGRQEQLCDLLDWSSAVATKHHLALVDSVRLPVGCRQQEGTGGWIVCEGSSRLSPVADGEQ